MDGGEELLGEAPSPERLRHHGTRDRTDARAKDQEAKLGDAHTPQAQRANRASDER